MAERGDQARYGACHDSDPMAPRAVLICGSRTWRWLDPIEALVAHLRRLEGHQEIVLIHGAAKGADQIAADRGKAYDMNVWAFAADWATHGKRAGYIRNQRMLEEGMPDVVYAFVDKPLAESKGTAMMVDLARRAGVPTYVTIREDHFEPSAQSCGDDAVVADDG